MAPITPYLFFDGNCREAMTFYKDCLGGELHLNEIGQSPGADQMPPEARKKIMHAALSDGAGGSLLMASDWMSNSVMAPGNNISLSLHCASDDQIRSLFAKLSEGGKVTNPLADQFWGATFGMLTDKFGIAWMLNFDRNTKKPGGDRRGTPLFSTPTLQSNRPSPSTGGFQFPAACSACRPAPTGIPSLRFPCRLSAAAPWRSDNDTWDSAGLSRPAS